MKNLFPATALGVGLTVAVLLLFDAGHTPPAMAQSGPISAQAINSPPLVGIPTELYNGSLGSLPASQGHFTYLTDPFFSASAQQTLLSDGVRLNTTPATSDKAGYFHLSAPPVLSRTLGFSVQFTAQISSESHLNNDRAGFSLIVLGSDLRGVELAFWQNEIWAQNDSPLFTHGERVTFDTSAGLVNYKLTMQDNNYTLRANGTQILSGTLRDYSAFGSPYTIPNFIFLGDDTTSAAADFKLTGVVVNQPPANRAVTAGDALIIDDVRVADLDAGSGTVALTLTVSSGLLTVTTTAPGGLGGGQISGNGSQLVQLSGTVTQLNSTLAYSPAITYRSASAISVTDTLILTLNDNGHSGGAPLTDTARVSIAVTGSGATLTNTAYLPIIQKNVAAAP